jgi:DNA-binding LacI/PurR family transcriptional regulator
MKSSPLYLHIAEELSKSICEGTLRPEDRIPSESEIIKRFNVSSITAKNALSHLCDQGYILRMRGKGSFVNTLETLQTIPEYRNKKYARARTNLKAVALILPSMQTKVDRALLDAVQQEVSMTEYMLLLTITRESQKAESAAIRQYVNNGVSGIILFPAEQETYNKDVMQLSIDKFPLVFVDRYLKGLKSCIVTIDNVNITKEATSQMIKHRADKILFMSPNQQNSVTLDRIKGFEEAMFDHKISINRDYFCLLPPELTRREEKYAFVKQALAGNGEVNGILCANEELGEITASLLYKEYPDKLGRISLCCFDGTDSPYFSSIKQDFPAIAAVCVKLLTNAILGEWAPCQIEIPASYVAAENDIPLHA